MLFKDLRSIMVEAEEPPADAPAEGEEAPAEETDKPRKPTKYDKDIKDASDGVGNEAYEVANEIATELQTILPTYYNVTNVSAKNKTVSIVTSEPELKSAKTNKKVNPESMLNTIQTLIAAVLGDEMDKFKLTGPEDPAIGENGEPSGELIITVVPV